MERNAFRRENRRNRGRNLARERHLDEDQRVVDQRRMEKGVATPVRRVDAGAQIVPILDLMYRLVEDDFFQHGRRRRPIDPAQHQEAAIEPGGEQVAKIGIDRRELGTADHCIEELLPHMHQPRRAPRGEVEPSKQLLSARLGCLVQFVDRRVGGGSLPSFQRRLDARAVRPEARQQCLEKGDARNKRLARPTSIPSRCPTATCCASLPRGRRSDGNPYPGDASYERDSVPQRKSACERRWLWVALGADVLTSRAGAGLAVIRPSSLAGMVPMQRDRRLL